MKRWLIPLVFLVLAALACDNPHYDPPRVLGVLADPETAGQVYAAVGTSESRATYVSRDYGRSWQLSDREVETGYAEGYSMQGDNLYSDGAIIWSFPRPTFRFFFLSDENHQVFALPGSRVSASEAHGVLYVGMGTEGVLTFSQPNDAPSGGWSLSAEGITPLKPLPLTITEPPTLAGIIALALLIPPLPLLHAYLLSRVWLYAVPGRRAWRAALLVTLLLTLLAALAVVVWLTDARTEYYPVVAVMSLICVLAGVAASLSLAPSQQAWWLAKRAALVSLIVPIGVASIWWGWLLIVPAVACFAIYRYAFSRELSASESLTPGTLDRLALTSLGLLLSGVFVVGLLLFGFGNLGSWRDVGLFLVWLIFAWFSIRVLFSHISRYLAARSIMTRSLRKTISITTILCYVLAPLLAFAVFYGQAAAYDWFTTLLVPG